MRWYPWLRRRYPSVSRDILTIPLDLRIQSPVHIGTGQEVLGSHYTRHNGTTGLLDIEQVVEAYPPADRDVTAIAEGEIDFSKLPDDPATYFRYELRTWAPLSDFEETTVAPVVKDEQNVPYIPGSTVKGWLRTALAFRALGGEPDGSITDSGRGGLDISEDVEGLFRPDGDISSDLFRCLRVTDAHPVSEPQLGVCQIRTRQYSQESKKGTDPKWMGYKIFAECLLPNLADKTSNKPDFKTELTVDLALLRSIIDQSDGAAESIFADELSETGVKNTIFSAVHDFQDSIIGVEKEIVEDWKYDQVAAKDEYRHFKNFYEEELARVGTEKPSSQFLIRSGRFTGQYSKTVMKTLSQEQQVRQNIDAPITHCVCEGEIKIDEETEKLYCENCGNLRDVFGLPVDPYPKTRRCIRRPTDPEKTEDLSWDHYPLGWLEAKIV